jgi:UDP-glucose 4-epimerase
MADQAKDRAGVTAFETARHRRVSPYSTLPARSRREIGEDHFPEIHIIHAIDWAVNGSPFSIFGDDYPTPAGAPARLYSCLTSRRRTEGAGRAHDRDNSCLQPRTGTPHCEGGDCRGRGRHRPEGALAAAARRAGDPVVRTRWPRSPEPLFTGLSRFDLKSIVETAWQWHQAHPAGYQPAAHRD